VANSEITVPEFDLHDEIESSELVKQARELDRHPAPTVAEAIALAERKLNELVAPSGLPAKEYISKVEFGLMKDESFGEAQFLYDMIQNLRRELK